MQMHTRILTLVALPFAAFSTETQALPFSYEMNLTTASGMGAGGMAAISSMMGGASGSNKSMLLRLNSSTNIPVGGTAEHTVPSPMQIGPVLTLKGERMGSGDPGESDGKVKIYWGCGSTIGRGQPEVIDFRQMGKTLSPEIAAMARRGRSAARSGGYGSGNTLSWPNGSDASSIPANASAVGAHEVNADFMSVPIRYSLDSGMDFLDPLDLKSSGSDLKSAIPLQWNSVSRSQGYNLNAVGANGEKEVVIWMADRNSQPMLPSSQHNCTIPAGIFEIAQGAVAMGEAVGPSKSFSYPPQDPGRNKPVVWSAKVSLNSVDTLMLGMGDLMGMERTSQTPAGRPAAPVDPAKEAADAVVPGGGAVVDAIKGIFGD